MLSTKTEVRAGCGLVVEPLPSMHKALSSSHRTSGTRDTNKDRKQSWGCPVVRR